MHITNVHNKVPELQEPRTEQHYTQSKRRILTGCKQESQNSTQQHFYAENSKSPTGKAYTTYGYIKDHYTCGQNDMVQAAKQIHPMTAVTTSNGFEWTTETVKAALSILYNKVLINNHCTGPVKTFTRYRNKPGFAQTTVCQCENRILFLLKASNKYC